MVLAIASNGWSVAIFLPAYFLEWGGLTAVPGFSQTVWLYPYPMYILASATPETLGFGSTHHFGFQLLLFLAHWDIILFLACLCVIYVS